MGNSCKIHILSCSGASNTGSYAYKVAHRIDKNGEANMFCVANIGFGDQTLICKLKSQQNK